MMIDLKKISFVALLLSLFWCGLQVRAENAECQQTAATIYQHASPAVVYINAISINPYRQAERVEHVVGSGFIIDSEGLVLRTGEITGRRVRNDHCRK